MEHVVIQYLSQLNIPVSEQYFKKCMLSHPDYPSLLSVADTLERLGINNQIGKLEEKKLNDIPFPCILQLDQGRGKMLLIKDQRDLTDHKDDLQHWEGVVIKVEPTSTIADGEHDKQHANEKLLRKVSLTLVAALVGLVLIPLLQSTNWLQLLLLATSIGGAIVGYLLIAKDLGITYRPVETFCNAGKRTNCDRILNAKDAQLFSYFSFSDVVMSYFAWQTIIASLFIPLLQGATSFFWVLALASILTLPVIGYSLYYQYAIAKTWCRLCVIIDGLLFLQVLLFAALYANGVFSLPILALGPAAISLLLLATIACSLLLLKNRLQTANASRREGTAAKRIKYNPAVFTHILLKGERADITAFEKEITIGTPEAPVQVIMIANLHCNPCRTAFESMTQLLEVYPQKVCFYIRFTQGMNKAIRDLSASTYLIRYWQQHIHGHEDEWSRTQALIDDWYARMNPQTFVEQYPANGELQESSNGTELLENRHYQWVKENEVIRTPTFFVNGYTMPRSYRMQDLMPMLPGLAALLQEQPLKLNTKELAQKQEG